MAGVILDVINTLDLDKYRHKLYKDIKIKFRNTFSEEEINKMSLDKDVSYVGIIEYALGYKGEDEKIRAFIDSIDDDLYEIVEIDKLEDAMGDSFRDGVDLISERSFTDYIRDYCISNGYVSDYPFINDNINWEGVADDFRYDYTEIEYYGRTYYYLR